MDGEKLSECLRLMGSMNKEDHVDPEIFIRNGVYTVYAEEFLDPE